MQNSWKDRRWWEKPAAFLNDYGWIFALILAIGLALFFTRCLWYAGFCPTKLVIKNSSPYDLTISLTGKKSVTFTVPKCLTCTEYSETGPDGCPLMGSSVTKGIAAGDYALSVAAVDPSADITPYAGTINIPNGVTSSQCFFVIQHEFGNEEEGDNAGTPTAAATSEPQPTIESQPASTDNTYNGSDYSLMYPQNWIISQNKIPTADEFGVFHDLVLTGYSPVDASQATPVSQEMGKLIINFVNQPDESLNEWIVKNYSWLNSNLETVQLGGITAISGQSKSNDFAGSDRFLWFEHNGKYYVVEGQLNSDSEDFVSQYEQILNSIVFN